MQHTHHRSDPIKEVDALPEPKAFGDAITLDHKILNGQDESRDHDRVICVITDRFTKWIQAYPANNKSSFETKKALQKFLGPQGDAKHVYSDNSKEIAKACDDIGLSADTSVPHRKQTNGIAENAVRKVKEGTSCALAQSKLSDGWWQLATLCYWFLRCIVDITTHEKTAYEVRFGEPFRGPVIPFGAHVSYNPQSPDDKARLHQMAEKTLQGIFAGYKQQAGGGFSGELIILDWDNLNEANTVGQVYERSIPHTEVFLELVNDQFHFPLASGDLNQPGERAHDSRKRKLKQKRKQEHQENLEEIIRKQEEEIAKLKADQPEDMPTSTTDFWTCNEDYITRHHQTQRTKLFIPTEENCPIPLKWLDVSRVTSTNLDEPNFATRIQNTSKRAGHIWPEVYKAATEAERIQFRKEWEEIRPKREEARKQRKIYYVGNDDLKDYEIKIKQVIKDHSIAPVPAMPIVPLNMVVAASATTQHWNPFGPQIQYHIPTPKQQDPIDRSIRETMELQPIKRPHQERISSNYAGE